MQMKFENQTHSSSIIKVIGVGGGGGNAVNYMYNQGIKDVDFIITNTDKQVLERSPIPVKIQLGLNITDGYGAGSIPETGKQAAMESIEEIKEQLSKGTKMVFITAGLGGGTGTGAAPVIAKIAKDMGILTVGIVTLPFSFEGRKRDQQARQGLEELRNNVDTLLVICNDKLRELHGDLKLSEAFHKADSILTVAAKGIAEIITVTGYINVDFNDVNTVMRNSGVAIMGTGIAEGENRALHAVEMAMNSPLLNDNDITGAKNILLYISSGEEEISMDEVSEITDYIQDTAGSTAEIIWGNGVDENMGKSICVTLIATGFHSSIDQPYGQNSLESQKKIVNLDKPAADTSKTEKKEPVEDEMKLIIKNFDSAKTDTETKAAPQEFKIDTPVLDKPMEIAAQTQDTTNEHDSSEMYIFKKSPSEMEESQPDLFHPTNEASTQTQKADFEIEEINEISNARVKHLKQLSTVIKDIDGLAEIERVPAFVRKNVVLDDEVHSSESHMSQLSLSNNPNNPAEIKKNTYLHSKPD